MPWKEGYWYTKGTAIRIVEFQAGGTKLERFFT